MASDGGRFEANWESLRGYRIPAWYEDGKFGIFIHWGVYAVPAFDNEWYPRNMYRQGEKAYEHHVATYGPQTEFGYKDFIPLFKAEKYDPAAWAALFAEAGAKFVVPVAEHHDGFAMYDSALSQWTAAKMGPERDVVGELAVHFLHESLPDAVDPGVTRRVAVPDVVVLLRGLGIDRRRGRDHADIHQRPVAHHREPEARGVRVQRPLHRPLRARELLRALHDHRGTVEAELVVVRLARMLVDGHEVRGVRRVLRHLLQAGADGVPGAERADELRVAALRHLGQLVERRGPLRVVPRHHHAVALEHRVGRQAGVLVQAPGVVDLRDASLAGEAPLVERALDQVADDLAAHGDVRAEVRAIGVLQVRTAVLVAPQREVAAEIAHGADLPRRQVGRIAHVEPAVGNRKRKAAHARTLFWTGGRAARANAARPGVAAF